MRCILERRLVWSFFCCCQHNPFPREFLVKIAIVMIKSKSSRRKSTKYQLSSVKGTRSLPATPHCLQRYTACIAVPPAMPRRLQRRTTCNASPPSTPTRLRCRTSCNGAPPPMPHHAPPAMLHRLERHTACNTVLPATPHCLQHCTACNAAMPARFLVYSMSRREHGTKLNSS